MDRETAIRIWNEVPGLTNVVTGRSLEEFANRVLAEGLRELRADFEALKDRHEADVLAEREACAKTCEDLWQEESTAAANGTQEPKYHDCIECAYAIRERSNLEFRGATPEGGAYPATKG